jgi:isoleucyl-tRNA synthetase
MDYKATLNLPKTDFPMKANLTEAEPRMLAWWEEVGIYKRLRQVAADRPLWILHDGPPYANGHIHLGHVLNKVLKDVIVKSRSMAGFNAVYVPGWDCHGLAHRASGRQGPRPDKARGRAARDGSDREAPALPRVRL